MQTNSNTEATPDNINGYVYVIRLAEPLGNDNHRAQFYVGWAKNLDGRFWHHCNGTGAAFTRAAVEKGIAMEIVYSIPGTRSDERAIKNQKNVRKYLQRRGIAV